ncbi:TM2 domain-containing 1 [Pelobates cultripes]|uniref:TM2 domain-containing 1 n=1 Tax=Pelobates cultripes TaxID=61616 RepID=A0AAD1SVG1_PELCU|nr:TM2 domain-containing 1 [Pelobates cultripes]
MNEGLENKVELASTEILQPQSVMSALKSLHSCFLSLPSFRHIIMGTNGYSYKIAVALSLFLGWLGADRFYLGYPALGLLKFCTVGFCGIGSLMDFILISMQIVGPSDGSSYIIDYYGARLVRLSINNDTYRKTQIYP